MTVPTDTPRSLDLEQVLEAGRAKIASIDASGPGTALTRQVLQSLQMGEPQDALRTVDDLLGAIGQLHAVLEEIHGHGEEAVTKEVALHPFGDVALDVLEQRLSGAAGSNWLALWLDAWTGALVDQQWECCRRIARIPPPPGVNARGQELWAISRCVEVLGPDGPDRRAAEALPDIAEVLAAGTGSAVAATRLWVLRSRILRRYLEDFDGAVECARHAESTAWGTNRDTIVLAQSEVAAAYLDAGNLAAARGITEGTVGFEAALPDLLIAAGRVTAKDGRFSKSDDIYDATALRFSSRAAESNLLRDTPANLLWRVGRRVGATDPESAVRLFDRALAKGIDGEGPYVDRRVWVDRAELLESMGLTEDAAHSYAAAAWRYSAVRSTRALRLYEKAHDLAPNAPGYAWSLAEELRFCAVTPDPEANDAMLRRASELIEQGFRVRRPVGDDAWAFVTAALVQWSLHEESDAAVCMECALLVAPSFRPALFHLSWLLRKQGYLQEALQASTAGIEVEPSEPFIVSAQVAALADLGKTAEAWETLAANQARWPQDERLQNRPWTQPSP